MPSNKLKSGGRGSNQYQQKGSSAQQAHAATGGATLQDTRRGVSQYVDSSYDALLDEGVWDEYLTPDIRDYIAHADPVMRQANSPVAVERAEAASSPAASAEVLARCVQDSDLFVRVGAAGNPASSSAILDRALRDPDSHVRFTAVTNPSATSQHLARGASDPDPAVQAAAVRASQSRGMNVAVAVTSGA